MSKFSKFIPLTGVVGSVIYLGLDLYINKTINESAFIAFMGFTIGGSAAYGIFKRMSKKNE